ncbi:MAG: hypothetical protein ACP5NQ_01490 [Vulcanisaeta sp.]
MKGHKLCNPHEIIELGLRLTEDAKRGSMSIDDAIDGLWEILTNLKYEIETKQTKTMPN